MWLYGEVESVSPTFTFMTVRILGVKEDAQEEVGEPVQLVDEKDPLGATLVLDGVGVPVREGSGGGVLSPGTGSGSASGVGASKERDLPPSPSVEVDESARAGDDKQQELW